MSEMSLRRRLASSGRRLKLPNPSFSPLGRSFKLDFSISSPNPNPPTRSSKTLKRCSSEPSFWARADDPEHALLFCPPTCFDIFVSSPSLVVPYSSPSTSDAQGLNKDAKVVVNVIVEGSPGPIRAMVKLGCSVEETIKLVVHKYSEEGRTPKFHKDAASTLELHYSYFSLQSLDKSELMGHVGSRSFYLRRSNGATSSFISDTAREAQPPPPAFLLPQFIARKIGKIMRRTRKLWKLMVCMQ